MEIGREPDVEENFNNFKIANDNVFSYDTYDNVVSDISQYGKEFVEDLKYLKNLEDSYNLSFVGEYNHNVKSTSCLEILVENDDFRRIMNSSEPQNFIFNTKSEFGNEEHELIFACFDYFEISNKYFDKLINPLGVLETRKMYLDEDEDECVDCDPRDSVF